MTKGTAVYRLYNAADELLYVGVANRPTERLVTHSSTKRWWSQVTRTELTWHPDRTSALKEEASAIRQERPRYNIVVPDLDGSGRGKIRADAPEIARGAGRDPALWGADGTYKGPDAGKPRRGRPRTGQEPIRRVRVRDEIWDAAKARAASEGRTMTDVILSELRRWVAEPPRRRSPDEETGD